MIKQINFQKNILFLLLLLAANIVFVSCDEDNFSQVVKIEIPKHEPKVAMSALWLSQDTLPFVHIDKSRGILDEENQPLPEDASVKLYINGSLADTAVFYSEFNNNREGKYIFPQLNYTPVAGDEFRLEATFDGLPVANAVQVMPDQISIDKAEYIPNGGGSIDGGQSDLLNVTFTDPGDSEDYYQIRLFNLTKYPDYSNMQDSITELQSTYLETNDPTLIMADGALLFSDKSFNGQQVTIKGQTYGGWGVIQSHEVHLVHITKEAYYYLTSLSTYWNAVDNPFSQPVNVYSNIKDGYGVFGMGNTYKKVF